MMEQDTPTEPPQSEEEEDGLPDRAADLEKEHLPQQLVDEIRRPLEGEVRALAQAYGELLSYHNDRVNDLKQALRSATKDNQHLTQSHQQNDLVQSALNRVGLQLGPQQQPQAQARSEGVHDGAE